MLLACQCLQPYLDDTEEGDLIHTDDDEKADEDGFSIIAMWNWERKNYFIKEQFNKRAILLYK